MEQNNFSKEEKNEFDTILDSLNEQLQQPASEEPSNSENNKLHFQKKKKKRFALLIGMILALIVLAFATVAMSDCFGIGKDAMRFQKTSKVQIIVEEGASVSSIARQLKEQDVLLSRRLFLLYVKVTDKANHINYGAHEFTTAMSYSDILESLAQPAKAADIAVTIPSGKTVEQILHILEDAGVCSYQELKNEMENGIFESPLVDAIPQSSAIYCKLEGYLFPDTYRFLLNDDPHQVIQKMIDNLEDKFTPEMRQKAENMGYTTHEILTMASVVEMESCGYYNEMPKVSALFYNRLNNWPAGSKFLQSDPTMYYPYGDGKYNTYKIEGLPPGPMSGVTESALKAALYPDETVRSYFFVTDSQGRFYYNDTLAAHEATISDLKQKGLWITTPFFE